MSRIRANNVLRGRLALVASVATIAIVMGGVMSNASFRRMLVRRYVEKTKEQYSYKNDRVYVVMAAVKVIKQDPFWGSGGSFEESYANRRGKATHNGYVNLAANFGLTPLVAVVAGIMSCLRFASRNRHVAFRRGHGTLWTIMYVFLCVYVVWSVQFNDILKEFFLFQGLTMLACACWHEHPLSFQCPRTTRTCMEIGA